MNIQDSIVQEIVTKLESGVKPWTKGWEGKSIETPRNIMGNYYRGINVLLLWLRAIANGYNSDIWMTFKQAKAIGGQVRKGEKGTQIIFYSRITKEDDTTFSTMRVYTVFNANQIDSLPDDITEEKEFGTTVVPELNEFFVSVGAELRIEGVQPCYVPSLDIIKMPEIKLFHTSNAYYATYAHELIHWTGHKSRLDRLGSDKRKDYAFEELIAELGSLFLCSRLGIPPKIDNSTAYIASWLKGLNNDKKFIFAAASSAQKAVDFILDNSNFNEDENSAEINDDDDEN